MFCGLIVIATVFWVCPPAFAADPKGDLEQIKRLQSTLADVAERVAPSVVAIRSEYELEELTDNTSGRGSAESSRSFPHPLIPSVGSGIVIDSGGLILTNEHVVHGAEPANIVCVLSSGEQYTVRWINADPRSDLAVLRINAKNLPPARLGDIKNVKQGHFAIVLGNPYGSATDSDGSPAMSFGIVSALGRQLTPQLDPTDNRYYGNLIQTDARINPGNSGGPLLNINGEVIGINTAVSTRGGGSQGIGFAIPIDQRVKDIIQSLRRGEAIEYGFLGVRLQGPGSSRGPRLVPANGSGAAVIDVLPDSPAARANLQPGDLITRFGDETVDHSDELIRLVGAARVGVPVDVTYTRDGKSRTATITPGQRPVLGADDAENEDTRPSE
jgi:serine protease Do